MPADNEIDSAETDARMSASRLLSMAGRQRLTDFEHVLLGLVAAAPSTGYNLKRRYRARSVLTRNCHLAKQ